MVEPIDRPWHCDETAGICDGCEFEGIRAKHRIVPCSECGDRWTHKAGSKWRPSRDLILKAVLSLLAETRDRGDITIVENAASDDWVARRDELLGR